MLNVKVPSCACQDLPNRPLPLLQPIPSRAVVQSEVQNVLKPRAQRRRDHGRFVELGTSRTQGPPTFPLLSS